MDHNNKKDSSLRVYYHKQAFSCLIFYFAMAEEAQALLLILISTNVLVSPDNERHADFMSVYIHTYTF